MGGWLNQLGSILGKAVPIFGAGMAGAGAISNIELGSKEKGYLDQLLALMNQYAKLTPGQAAAGIQQFEQPLSQDLINNIMRQVQAQAGEAGLSGAPGLYAEATAEALAPYQAFEQQLAAQSYFNLLGLPLEAAGTVKFPQGADVSSLLQALMQHGSQSDLQKLLQDLISKVSGAAGTAPTASLESLEGLFGSSGAAPAGPSAADLLGSLGSADVYTPETLPLLGAGGAAGGGTAGLAELPLGTSLSPEIASSALGGAALGGAGVGAGIGAGGLAELPLGSLSPELVAAATPEATAGGAAAGGAGAAGAGTSLLGVLGTAAIPAAAFTAFNLLFGNLGGSFEERMQKYDKWVKDYMASDPVHATIWLDQQKIDQLTQQLHSPQVPARARESLQNQIDRLYAEIAALEQQAATAS